MDNLNYCHGHPYFTKFRKIDETVPRYLICHIHNLLLHGVQTQHLHGGQQVLEQVVEEDKD